MPFPSSTYLHNIQGVVTWVADEFEALYSQLFGWLSKEHNEDGTHGAITATSLTLNGYAAGTVTNIPYNPLNFSAIAGLWTVGAADQITYAYSVTTHVMTIWFDLINTATTAITALTIALPPGYVCQQRATGVIRIVDGGVSAVGLVQIAAGTSVINVYATVAGGNFAIGAPDIMGTLTIPV